MNILLFGPQGSGKGTQGERLAAHYHIPLIGVGTLLREEAKKETERGRTVRKELKSGRLVPETITNEITFDRLRKMDTERGFILDGYPRNTIQEDALRALLLTLRAGTRITHVIVLELSDADAIARLSGRRFCSVCGETYHIQHKPSKKDGVCDACGGQLIQRPDDTPETIKKRLAIYHTETAPLLADYERDGIVRRIDANVGIDEVFERIIAAIEK